MSSSYISKRVVCKNGIVRAHKKFLTLTCPTYQHGNFFLLRIVSFIQRIFRVLFLYIRRSCLDSPDLYFQILRHVFPDISVLYFQIFSSYFQILSILYYQILRLVFPNFFVLFPDILRLKLPDVTSYISKFFRLISRFF